MLKRTIKYTDYNDNETTEAFYFNLTKSELVEFEVSYKDGFQDTLERIIATDDREKLIAEFKKIILASYGQKSDDGKRFIKSDELRTEFSQSAAYNELFMELATNENAAADFINGVMPKALMDAAKQENLANEASAMVEKAKEVSTQKPPTQEEIDAAQKIIDSHKMPPPSA